MIKTHLFIQQNMHSDKEIPTGNLFPTACQPFIFILLMFLSSFWLTHSWLCTLSHFPRRPLFMKSQPFSSGWKCCPQAAIVTWNKDASLLQKRLQGLFFIYIFIFFIMHAQISIVKKSRVIPEGCAFHAAKVCSALRLNCSILWKRERVLSEKHSATLRSWTESDHGFCCIPSSSFHFLSGVCSLPVPHLCPLKSVGSQLHSWPSVITLLLSGTLPWTVIYIHFFNSLVNDLRGVNHSQGNGCKKLIDIIFMI